MGYIMKLFSILRHAFIPHKENDYKPHFLREHTLLSLFILSILLLLISFSSYTLIRTTHYGSSVAESILLDLTNTSRIRNGLPPLAINEKLRNAARMKSEDMVTRRYFSHYAPDGTTPWSWITKAGYKYTYAGENLAIRFNNSYAIEKAWLNSPTHRENILNPNYHDTGLLVVNDTSSSIPSLFVVQMFGKETTDQAVTKETPRASFFMYLIFNTPYYITCIYKLIITLLIVAIALMIFIEIKKQHYLHIFYGILLITLVILCILINSQITST